MPATIKYLNLNVRLRIAAALCAAVVISDVHLQAELPKAISVSPMAVAPGATSTLAVHGLNLQEATELWTDLDARSVPHAAADAQTLKSAFGENSVLPPGAITREAESYDRGQFARSGNCIVNGNFDPNYAEWDVQADAGNYVLEFKYAAGGSRPVMLYVNGTLLTETAAAGVTGGFADTDAQWMVECVVSLKKGQNTVRIQRPGGTPHFDSLALIPTQEAVTRFSTVQASDRVAPFDMKVSETTAVGIHGLRVANPEGISEMLLFMVDDLPTVTEIRSESGSPGGQPVALPAAVEGYCDTGAMDRYMIDVVAGQSVSIEAVAARLGTRLDPILRLLNPDGLELMFADDTAGMTSDCCLRYQFTEAGRYQITIEDALMSGASSHRYRLRIGDFPILSSPLPAAVSTSSSQAVTFAGHAVAGLQPRIFNMESNGTFQVSATFAGSRGSGFTQLAATDIAQTVIPSDGSIMTVTVPCGISGVLSKPGEIHACRFRAEKGTRLRFSDSSRAWGVPAVVSMKVREHGGAVLTELKRAGTAGRQLKWTVPADGEYELVLSDLTSRGGSEFGYHVNVSIDAPDFKLSVEQDSTIMPQNGYSILKIAAVRDRYNGPIHLSVKGPASEVRLGNSVIAEKAKDTRLKIYVPPDMKPGQTTSLRIVGTAVVDEQTIQRPAETLAAFRKVNSQTPFPPDFLNGLIAATVGPEIPDFFGLSIDDNAILFPRYVGEVYFTVRVKDRVKGFTAPVQVRVEGFPDGFTAGGGASPVSRSENNEYRFQLSGPRDLDRAAHRVRVVAEAEYRGQTKEIELTDVPLKIVDPLMIQVLSDGPLSAGRTHTLTVRARRFVPRAGGDKKQIELRFSNVPEGVIVPETSFIPAGNNETVVKISVGRNVDMAALNKMKISAATTVADHEVTVFAPISVKAE